jgi:membrane-bound lytic murein transglycosylase D
MVKSIRIKNGYCFIALSLCLLIIYSKSFAFFKKPDWWHLSRDANFWSELSQDFKINCDASNPKIQRQIRWYQQHPKHLQKTLKAAEPFIHYVYQQTRQKKLPAELALIPLIESQYNPGVGGRNGPAGLWQMMPGTATKFGLNINNGYDGRRDVTASTRAALTYLSYLHRYFGNDWLLALAAYQSGEGKVQAAARRCDNFWTMPLRRATNEYVPKLLAIALIIKQPNQYHLTLPTVAKHAHLQEVVWNEARVINLARTAQDLGVDDVTLKRFNPGIRKNMAHVPQSLTLLVPATPLHDARDIPPPTYKQQDHTKSLPPPKHVVRSKNKNYKIRSGDTLTAIAKRHHITVKQLRQANHLKDAKQLKIGKVLIIPKR